MAKYSNETFLERQLDRLSKQTGLFLVRLFYVPCLKKPEDRDPGVAAVALRSADEPGWAEPDLSRGAACTFFRRMSSLSGKEAHGAAHASSAQIWLGAASANLFPYWIGRRRTGGANFTSFA
jgi:hypothetical protein